MSDNPFKLLRRRTWIAWAIVLLPFLAVLSLPFWAGRWYWSVVQRELAAKGEKLFAKDFQRSPIPDSENYFAIPFFKEAIATQNRPPSVSAQLKEAMGNFRSERNFLKPTGAPILDMVAKPVSLETYARGLPADATVEEKRAETLQWMEKFLGPWDPLRRELLTECHRSGSYAAVDLSKGQAVDISANSAALGATQFCYFHAIAALARGDTKSAFEDVVIMQRLAKATSGEPTIMHSLVAVACNGMADRVVRDGMHLWSDEQLIELARIQPSFERKNIADTLRAERAFSNATFEKIAEGGMADLGSASLPAFVDVFGHIPLANYNLSLQEVIALVESPASMPADFDAIDSRLASMGKVDSLLHFFEKLAMPAFSSYVRKVLRQENQTRLTRVAIALEQYRRKHGGTPAKLEDLVPEFIDRIPEGAIPGQSIRYLPGTGGGYKIWTDGWNGTDEGGTPDTLKDDNKDWVMEYEPQP